MRTLTDADRSSSGMASVMAGFARNASASIRTTAAKAIATLHQMSLASTNNLTYDPTLKEFGRNVKKDVTIGPSAFEQDYQWLAAVVYHELVHSDQFDVYAKHGVALPKAEARNETERLMVALDEAEAFYRTYQQRDVLKLSTDQANFVRTRVIHKLFDVDDKVAKPLAAKFQFAQARLALIGAWKK